MEFSYLRAGKSAVATAAFALVLTGPVTTPAALAQDAAQTAPAAGQPGAKNWKDRAEYDLYVQITQATDPKKRLELLNSWKDKYPATDYSKERAQIYVATYGQLAGPDPSVRPKLLEAAQDQLKIDPKDFNGLYFTTLWGPAVGGANPSPDLLTQVDSAAHGVLDSAETKFAPAGKPAAMSDADWAKAKNQVIALAHNALAWEGAAKKDLPTAENEYKASLTANPENGTIAYTYGETLQKDKKYGEALYEYARAAQYDGPASIPADKRATVLAYFNKVYAQFHGSPDGADKVLAAAKASALPPPDFKIEGAGDLAQKQADELQARINTDPGFKLWYTLKQSLTGDAGDSFFSSNVKGAEIPGTAVAGVKSFTGTVVSLEPPDKPTKITVAVEDPTKADATLVYDNPIPPTAVKVGDKIEFSGSGQSFTKDPFMITFTNPVVPGIKATAAEPKKPVVRRPRHR